jgi:hypothetical protein
LTFLSYASQDLDTVRRLYDGLKQREVNIWFDRVDLDKGSGNRRLSARFAAAGIF